MKLPCLSHCPAAPRRPVGRRSRREVHGNAHGLVAKMDLSDMCTEHDPTGTAARKDLVGD